MLGLTNTSASSRTSASTHTSRGTRALIIISATTTKYQVSSIRYSVLSNKHFVSSNDYEQLSIMC